MHDDQNRKYRDSRNDGQKHKNHLALRSATLSRSRAGEGRKSYLRALRKSRPASLLSFCAISSRSGKPARKPVLLWSERIFMANAFPDPLQPATEPH
jgi:hypothetical protein